MGNWITLTAFGYAALCTIIMLFVAGTTELENSRRPTPSARRGPAYRR
jgi:hypothetical protein